MKTHFLPLTLCGWASLAPLKEGCALTFGTQVPDMETAGAQRLDGIVAVVNDDVITRRELDAAIVRMVAQLKERKIPLPSPAIFEQQVLERLILGQLINRLAERYGITIDDATLNTALENIAQHEQRTLPQFREKVEKGGIDFGQFRDEIRRELLGMRLRQKLVDNQARVSDQEVDSRQAQMTAAQGNAASTATRYYHLAQILIAVPENASPAQVVAAKSKAADIVNQLRRGADFQQLAVQVSADRQALEGGDLGWRPADQLPTLFSDVVPHLKPGEVSDALHSASGFHIVKLVDMRDNAAPQGNTSTKAASGHIVQTRARHILLKATPERPDTVARERLVQLRSDIRAGKDFAELARAHSDDQGSKEQGGALDWASPGTFVPEFERAMKGLKPNAISAPFKSSFGWHIVQVLERREVPATVALSRTKVREALMRQRADEEWERTLRRLRDEAYVEVRLSGNAPP